MLIKTKKTRLFVLSCLCAAALFSAGCSGDVMKQGDGSGDSEILTETGSETVEESKASTAVSTEQTVDEKKESETRETDYDEGDFYISNISDDIFERIKGKSYSDDCTVSLDDLRYLHVLHKDIEGETLEGELICNRYIAQDLLEIFEELYKADYPIERIRLVDEYEADDETSMRDNNSSCFNFRFITGTEIVSMHGEGLAIDINPLYNPFHSQSSGITEPATGEDYLDRDEDFDYKIEDDDICVRLFKAHGFDWGGDWTEPKDYQHFEKEL